MSFLLHLPSPFLPSLVLLRSYFFSVYRNVGLRMKVRQKETTQGKKEDESTERRREKKDNRKEQTQRHKHIYFITKQNKSAWRKDITVSNSQIKQALIKTSLSLAVLQITFTNSISWKHTFHTKTVTKHNPLLHFHSNNLNPRDSYQWSRWMYSTDFSVHQHLSVWTHVCVCVSFYMRAYVNRSPKLNYSIM